MSTSKGKPTSKLSGEQRKALFWKSIQTQTLNDLRDTLTNTAIEAHTRHEETGRTSIMEAAKEGKIKSLDCLLDWYERRKVLRPKGWIDLKDDENGRTALMLAASGGHLDCVESLIRYEANVQLKDDEGKTARDIAFDRKKTAIVEFIDDFLKPPSSGDDNDGGEEVEGGEGLTNTQKRKLKKKGKAALEQVGNVATATKEDETPATTGAINNNKQTRVKEPAPTWDEVSKLCDSFDNLRPLYDAVITRAESTVDEALFNCHWIKVLRLKLSGSSFTTIPGQQLMKLADLQSIILSGNATLTSLPEEIGTLKRLKVLELEGCALKKLPDALRSLPLLESLNVSNNQLETITPALDSCASLTILNLAGNKLTCTFDNFSAATSPRLSEIKFGKNKCPALSPTLATLPNLAVVEGENNLIKEIPAEFSQLKKIKKLKLDGNPIADQKVVKMLQQEGKGLKDLLKYLEKNNNQKKDKGKNENKNNVSSPSKEQDKQEESSDLDIDEDDL